MISTYQLSKIDARLKQAHSSQLPFGGMHVIFFGDFVQYPPVAGRALFVPIGETKKSTQKGNRTTLFNLHTTSIHTFAFQIGPTSVDSDDDDDNTNRDELEQMWDTSG